MTGYLGRDPEVVKECMEIASPLRHVLPGFPPCYIATSEIDPLHSETLALLPVLDKQGVDYEYLNLPRGEYPHTQHGFLNFWPAKGRAGRARGHRLPAGTQLARYRYGYRPLMRITQRLKNRGSVHRFDESNSLFHFGMTVEKAVDHLLDPSLRFQRLIEEHVVYEESAATRPSRPLDTGLAEQRGDCFGVAGDHHCLGVGQHITIARQHQQVESQPERDQRTARAQ